MRTGTLHTRCRRTNRSKPVRTRRHGGGRNLLLAPYSLRLVVVAEKQVYTPGEFSKYADRYLRLSQINQEPYTKWSIKSIDMVPYGVPDPQKVYSIQLKKRTVAPLVGLTSEGILLSINTDGEEEPLPAVPKGNDAPKRLNPRDYMNQEILLPEAMPK